MKTKTILLSAFVSVINLSVSKSQSSSIPAYKVKAAIISLNGEDVRMANDRAADILKLELEKTDSYEVIDRYDAAYILKGTATLDNCYALKCLLEVGEKIECKKIFTGRVMRIDDNITIELKMIDVPSKSIEKTEVIEFLNIPNEVSLMIGITLKKMLGIAYDDVVYNNLTKKHDFENANNTPHIDRLRLDGPRMGVLCYTGKTAHLLSSSKSNGGFDAAPVMFQFGYQFEKQYLNEGNFQALLEVIPMMTGIEQQLFIPSITVLNGLRSNIGGWEFAFGPTFNIIQTAKVYDDQGRNLIGKEIPESKKYDTKVQLDSRGDYHFNSSFVFAFGKSFRSGSLNIPFNIYVVPTYKEGIKVGVSFGFNAKNMKSK